MLNVRLAGGHLYGNQVFTWLSLVVSLMASFVLSLFPVDVLDEIWDLIESVSEGFLTYSSRTNILITAKVVLSLLFASSAKRYFIEHLSMSSIKSRGIPSETHTKLNAVLIGLKMKTY